MTEFDDKREQLIDFVTMTNSRFNDIGTSGCEDADWAERIVAEFEEAVEAKAKIFACITPRDTVSREMMLECALPDVLIALHEAMQAHPDLSMHEVILHVCEQHDVEHGSDYWMTNKLRAYAKPPGAKDRLRAALDAMDALEGAVVPVESSLAGRALQAARAVLDEVQDD